MEAKVAKYLNKGYVINKSSVIIFLLTLSLFLSQFYLWESGIPQFSHIIMIVTLLFYIPQKRYFSIYKIRILFIFIAYSLVVNLIWLIINKGDISYIYSILYWIFNFLFVFLFINLNDDDINKYKKLLLKTIFFSFVLEILVWVLGGGRYDYAPRYNGFFNDPNQMAFWVLGACSIYLYISEKKINNIIVYFLAIFLILLTLSRSALLGIPFLGLALVLKQRGKISNKIILITFSAFLAFFIFYFLYSLGYFDGLFSRFIEGIDEKDKQSQDRGFDILLKYPEYLLFGAGQGGYSLFSATSHEIHSTWFGMLFYYGIFGLGIFLLFLLKIFKKLPLADKILLLGPMVYGFTTYSARAAIFWFIISIFLIGNKEKK